MYGFTIYWTELPALSLYVTYYSSPVVSQSVQAMGGANKYRARWASERLRWGRLVLSPLS